MAKDKNVILTLHQRPSDGEMLKASELIEIYGAEKLPLNARRIYNLLLHNAHGPDMAIPHHKFRIPLSELKYADEGRGRVRKHVMDLMGTFISFSSTDRNEDDLIPLVGYSTIGRNEESGYLTYQFDPRLVSILSDSQIFAKLQLDVIRAVSSKYALALYELIAKRARLSYVRSETFDIDQFRALIGVPAGKLGTYSNLLKFAITPAFEEVNKLADFHVAFEPIKEGRRVGSIKVAWAIKDVEARKLAYQALQGAPAREELTEE